MALLDALAGGVAGAAEAAGGIADQTIKSRARTAELAEKARMERENLMKQWEEDRRRIQDERRYNKEIAAAERTQAVEDAELGHTRDIEKIEHRAAAEAKNRRKTPPGYEKVIGQGGQVFFVNKTDPNDVISPTQPGSPTQSPLISAPTKADSYRTETDPFGNVTRTNSATGDVDQYNKETKTWERLGQAAPGGAELPENPSDDDLRRYYRAKGVPDEKIESALANRSGTPGQPATTHGYPDAPPAQPLTPTKNTDAGIREAYALTPELVGKMLEQASDLARSGTPEQIRIFMDTNGDGVRIHAPELYPVLMNQARMAQRAAQPSLIDRARSLAPGGSGRPGGPSP